MFSKSVFIEYGDDHVVAILDEKIVFRFPRTATYRKSFNGELKLLAALKDRTPLPVPDYVYLSKKKDFGGYKLIKGKELTEARFARSTNVQKKRIIRDIAQFLRVMHQINKNILPASRAEEPWSMDDLKQYKTRYWMQRRKILASFVDTPKLEQIDAFYDAFVHVCQECRAKTIIHGDLSVDHVLLDITKGRLSGIIDFGDAAIGDPAHDFAFLWSYGDEVVRAVYQKYGLHKDKELLDRSEWYYVRHLIDRLYACIYDKKMRTATRILKILGQRLTALLDSNHPSKPACSKLH